MPLKLPTALSTPVLNLTAIEPAVLTLPGSLRLSLFVACVIAAVLPPVLTSLRHLRCSRLTSGSVESICTPLILPRA